MHKEVSPDFDPINPFIRQILKPDPIRVTQSFEYYAAHFLVGCGLITGDLDGHIRALAHELKLQHDMGHEIGLRHPAHTRRPG